MEKQMSKLYEGTSFLEILIKAANAKKEVTEVTNAITNLNNKEKHVTSERLQAVTGEVTPQAIFRSVAKQPDQCLGGYCPVYRRDNQGQCETVNLLQIMTTDCKCPMNRWRVYQSEGRTNHCNVCGSTDWWKPKGQNGEWICVVCHPPALRPFLCDYKK
jgi:hypothetical protein